MLLRIQCDGKLPLQGCRQVMENGLMGPEFKASGFDFVRVGAKRLVNLQPLHSNDSSRYGGNE